MSLELEHSWKELLSEEFQKPYFWEIKDFLTKEIEAWKTIYPHPKNIFAALNTTPVEEVKVVILGQDPYHGPDQAHGLSFSVQDGVKLPPSLRNIYKEIEAEWFPSPGRRGVRGEVWEDGGMSWNLSHWAEQWVLLLNSILTVEAGKPASHSKIGWEQFTDSIIKKLSDSQEGIIFVLWGNFARSKKALIDTDTHFILESSHPSPFSAYNGFFWNGHFQKINEILREQGNEEIRW